MIKIFTFVFLLCFAPVSFAMCVTANYDLVAWNGNGNAALIKITEYGPEGGGSVAFHIIDFSTSVKMSYMFSSNFSPGDGSTPQAISTEKCRTGTTNANQVLKNLNFGFQLSENCDDNRVDFGAGAGSYRVLDSQIILAICKQAGYEQSRAAVFSKDKNHFIIIDSNKSCNASMKEAIWDNSSKSYKVQSTDE